ncbi:poly [ADP-ribose] polymerase tankyrase-2-like isoform X2 [Xyrauchen texanus]|uniref:poly [ADP-ribose] polymerase tankyrase-2-like isoform X2 n=1 Tax=Xyrauchen texanus TaxID=154827 RepID=UPI002241CFBB|nr:poly [ADP-ribose] polymerase tankyrase-2-like isoform X2 [Xyrauchen texanus]
MLAHMFREKVHEILLLGVLEEARFFGIEQLAEQLEVTIEVFGKLLLMEIWRELDHFSKKGLIQICETRQTTLLWFATCQCASYSWIVELRPANFQTRGGASPHHRAAYCSHHSVVKLLLHHSADPCLTDDDGATPLHKVAEQGHLEVCELLVNRCPALQAVKDKRSNIPLDLCPEKNTLWEILRPPQ